MTGFMDLVRRDIRLAMRQGSGIYWTLMFFLLTITLFPLGVGPEQAILGRIATGVVWVAALLAAMLSLDRLFQADYEDGSLELLALAPVPMEIIVLAKCTAHWITTGLPLAIAAPFMGMMLNMDPAGFLILTGTMLLGTPVLSLIGGIGAALTVGVRRGGVLLSLLVLPLYVPTLIFGVIAVDEGVNGLGAQPHIMLLSAMLLGAIALAPWASAAALRLNME
ncbi:MAG: heme exporter protein CcmB [Alphaproteobacteria bacterium]|jgi:heme exporter protein B|nr:heme exporter protein CcmB [Alphaproteobacteria bacterium]MBT4711781.1 heme exporter protein CcmB [Alphaproteobacteria bacterium]